MPVDTAAHSRRVFECELRIQGSETELADRARRSTSLTLDRGLLDEARDRGVNISRAAEAGLPTAVRAARRRRWSEENAAAIAD